MDGKARWILLLVLLGYLILTVLFTRPLAWRFQDGYIADLTANADGSYHFNPYHLQQCMSHGSSCLHTDLQCHPVGNNLRWNTNTPIPSLLAQLFRNTTTGLNIVLLLNTFLTAFGGYLFARLWIRSRWLAFTAGAFFAFWMGRSAHLWHGHANLMFTAPLPFALLAFHHAFPGLPERIEWKWSSIGAALNFLVLTVACAFHDLVIGGYVAIYISLMATLVLYRHLIFPMKWHWQVLILVSFMLLSDQLVQWLLKWGVSPNGAFFYSGSLLNLFYPHPVSMAWSSIVFPDGGAFKPVPGLDPGRVMFPGVAIWLLTLFAIVTARKLSGSIRYPWLLVFMIMGILYMMPLFRWNSTRWIYGPFALSHFVPMWNENRCPTRFADVIALLGPVWVLASVETWPWWTTFHKPAKAVMAVLLSALLLAEHYPRAFPFADLRHGPKIYETLASSPGNAVIFVPFGIIDGKKAFGQLWLEPFAFQPVYGRPMCNGLLSRIDAKTWKFFEQDSFTCRLVRVQTWLEKYPDQPVLPDSGRYSPLDSVEMVSSVSALQITDIVLAPETAQSVVGNFVYSCVKPFIVQDSTFPEGHRWLSIQLR